MSCTNAERKKDSFDIVKGIVEGKGKNINYKNGIFTINYKASDRIKNLDSARSTAKRKQKEVEKWAKETFGKQFSTGWLEYYENGDVVQLKYRFPSNLEQAYTQQDHNDVVEDAYEQWQEAEWAKIGEEVALDMIELNERREAEGLPPMLQPSFDSFMNNNEKKTKEDDKLKDVDYTVGVNLFNKSPEVLSAQENVNNAFLDFFIRGEEDSAHLENFTTGAKEELYKIFETYADKLKIALKENNISLMDNKYTLSSGEVKGASGILIENDTTEELFILDIKINEFSTETNDYKTKKEAKFNAPYDPDITDVKRSREDSDIMEASAKLRLVENASPKKLAGMYMAPFSVKMENGKVVKIIDEDIRELPYNKAVENWVPRTDAMLNEELGYEAILKLKEGRVKQLGILNDKTDIEIRQTSDEDVKKVLAAAKAQRRVQIRDLNKEIKELDDAKDNFPALFESVNKEIKDIEKILKDIEKSEDSSIVFLTDLSDRIKVLAAVTGKDEFSTGDYLFKIFTASDYSQDYHRLIGNPVEDLVKNMNEIREELYLKVIAENPLIVEQQWDEETRNKYVLGKSSAENSIMGPLSLTLGINFSLQDQDIINQLMKEDLSRHLTKEQGVKNSFLNPLNKLYKPLLDKKDGDLHWMVDDETPYHLVDMFNNKWRSKLSEYYNIKNAARNAGVSVGFYRDAKVSKVVGWIKENAEILDFSRLSTVKNKYPQFAEDMASDAEIAAYEVELRKIYGAYFDVLVEQSIERVNSYVAELEVGDDSSSNPFKIFESIENFKHGDSIEFNNTLLLPKGEEFLNEKFRTEISGNVDRFNYWKQARNTLTNYINPHNGLNRFMLPMQEADSKELLIEVSKKGYVGVPAAAFKAFGKGMHEFFLDSRTRRRAIEENAQDIFLPKKEQSRSVYNNTVQATIRQQRKMFYEKDSELHSLSEIVLKAKEEGVFEEPKKTLAEVTEEAPFLQELKTTLKEYEEIYYKQLVDAIIKQRVVLKYSRDFHKMMNVVADQTAIKAGRDNSMPYQELYTKVHHKKYEGQKGKIQKVDMFQKNAVRGEKELVEPKDKTNKLSRILWLLKRFPKVMAYVDKMLYSTLDVKNRREIADDHKNKKISDEMAIERLYEIGKDPTIRSVLQAVLINVGRVKSLGYSGMSGLRNVIEGGKTNEIAAAENKAFNMEELMSSRRALMKFGTKGFQTIYKFSRAADLLQDRKNILEKEDHTSMYKSTMRDTVLASGLDPLALSITLPEFQNQVEMAISMAQRVMVKGNDGKMYQLFDGNEFTIYIPGTLDLKPNFVNAENTANWVNFGVGKKDLGFHMYKSEYTTRRNHYQGNYSTIDATWFTDRLIGQLLSVFKKWAPAHFAQRYEKGGTYDLHLQRVREGGRYIGMTVPQALMTIGVYTLMSVGATMLSSILGIAVVTALSMSTLAVVGNINTTRIDDINGKKVNAAIQTFDYVAEVAKASIMVIPNRFGINAPIDSRFKRYAISEERRGKLAATAQEAGWTIAVAAIGFLVRAAIALGGDDDDTEDEKKARMMKYNKVTNEAHNLIQQTTAFTNPINFFEDIVVSNSAWREAKGIARGAEAFFNSDLSDKKRREQKYKIAPLPKPIKNALLYHTPFTPAEKIFEKDVIHEYLMDKMDNGEKTAKKSVLRMRENYKDKLKDMGYSKRKRDKMAKKVYPYKKRNRDYKDQQKKYTEIDINAILKEDKKDVDN